jgi:hypothetical protein
LPETNHRERVTFLGSSRLNEEGLEKLCKILNNTMGDEQGIILSPVDKNIISLMSPSNNDVQWRIRSFAEALETFSRCNCSMPEDRVYGILALPYRTQRPPPIEVVPGKSIAKIFEEAVTYMLQELKPFYQPWALNERYHLFANLGKNMLPDEEYLDVLRNIPEANGIVAAIEDAKAEAKAETKAETGGESKEEVEEDK